MKKRILMLGSVLVLALLLAGAAFVGGRLLYSQGFAPAPSVPRIQPAAELPQKAADVFGILNHRQDKSIFLDEGKIGQGPTVEVVVTTQTIIHADVTSREINGKVPEGQTVQQVLEPGSLDEIGQDSAITVWGRKTGDRYIADVLVYTLPEIFTK